MDDLIQTIYSHVIAGNQHGVEESVGAAISGGVSPSTILQDGLVDAMSEVGMRFEQGDFFIPDMVIAARAMKTGLAELKPHLGDGETSPLGTVVLGTVKGDLHDIGKNLVGMMMEGSGFRVIDAGTNVAPQAFADAVVEHQPRVLGLSALLTTTMMNMRATIQELVEAGLRDQVKIIVGGAPLSEDFAREIGADGFASDAGAAVRLSKMLLEE